MKFDDFATAVYLAGSAVGLLYLGWKVLHQRRARQVLSRSLLERLPRGLTYVGTGPRGHRVESAPGMASVGSPTGTPLAT